MEPPSGLLRRNSTRVVSTSCHWRWLIVVCCIDDQSNVAGCSWVLLVVLIINQTKIVGLIEQEKRDRHWLLIIGIVIVVVGCRCPTVLGVLRWVLTGSWCFWWDPIDLGVLRQDLIDSWCFEARSNQLLVFCGKIQPTLVFCNGFRLVIGVFRCVFN